MTLTSIQTDRAGNANLFAGLRTTCGDLLRLGELLLDGGRIGDVQVIPTDYIDLAMGAPSTDLNAAYGLLWWLNRPGIAVTPEVATGGPAAPSTGPIVPAAPADAFWALGFHQQILAVIPSLNVVAVRLGGKPPNESFGVESFTVDVLALLD